MPGLCRTARLKFLNLFILKLEENAINFFRQKLLVEKDVAFVVCGLRHIAWCSCFYCYHFYMQIILNWATIPTDVHKHARKHAHAQTYTPSKQQSSREMWNALRIIFSALFELLRQSVLGQVHSLFHSQFSTLSV